MLSSELLHTLPAITGSISYTRHAVHFGQTEMARADRVLKDVDFDMIVGTGMSGCLVVPKLAEALDKEWAVVRKEEESSHRSQLIEGTRMGKRWLFVDDFVSSGTTLIRVIKNLNRFVKDRGMNTELVGVYSYKDKEYWNLDQCSEYVGYQFNEALNTTPTHRKDNEYDLWP